ncbi:MAG: hypothetical protein JXR76_15055 [Deltaproteobacteria bacterium]|nr:hypothetical protein [Deltaproteobacteria bacterium]
MKKISFLLVLYFGFILPMTALGQDGPSSATPPANMPAIAPTNEASAGKPQSETPTEESKPTEAATNASPVVQENTVAQCGDKKDNDNDGHVDCADQDCGIFSICVNHSTQSEPSPARASSSETEAASDESSSEELIVRPFSIGFVPGLSTDSAASGEVLNHFSLNFIGWQDHLRGAEFSILGAIRKGSVTGFQGSHLFNVVAGDMRGFQGSGIVNVAAGDTVGLQATGLVNVAGKSFRGIQASGLGNFAGGPFVGLQLTGLANVVTGDGTGFQGSGLVNVTSGAMNGFQATGLVNVSKKGGKGVQASGVANVATGDFKGLQLSLVNVGTHVTGAQVGLINIASKSMKGAALGLINFAGDGIFAPTIWVSPASMVNLGLKMGTRNVYSLLGAGVHPVGDDKRTSLAFGFGVHGDVSKRLWLEFDLMHNRLHDRKFDFESCDVDFIEQARLNLGFRFADDFSLYAGPTLDVLVSEVRDESGFATFYTHTDKSSDTSVAISLGLTAGIQWEPKIGNLNRRD